MKVKLNFYNKISPSDRAYFLEQTEKIKQTERMFILIAFYFS